MKWKRRSKRSLRKPKRSQRRSNLFSKMALWPPSQSLKTMKLKPKRTKKLKNRRLIKTRKKSSQKLLRPRATQLKAPMKARLLVKQLKKQEVKKAVLVERMAEEAVEREAEVAEANIEVEAATEVIEDMKVAIEAMRGVVGEAEVVTEVATEVVKVEKEAMATSSIGTRDQELQDHLRMMKIVTSRSLARRRIISEVEEEEVIITELDAAVPTEEIEVAIEVAIEEAREVIEVAEATEEEKEEVVVTSHQPPKMVRPRPRSKNLPLLLNESCTNNFSCFYY